MLLCVVAYVASVIATMGMRVSALVVWVGFTVALSGAWSVADRAHERRVKKRQRREQGLCGECGYDVRATPGRCPECGTPTPAAGTP
jgi:hypothetical protein